MHDPREQIYDQLVDSVACFLYSVFETETNQDLTHYQQYFKEFIAKYDNTKHAGDCTQQPFMCLQCLIDDFRDRAKSIIDKTGFDVYMDKEEIE